ILSGSILLSRALYVDRKREVQYVLAHVVKSTNNMATYVKARGDNPGVGENASVPDAAAVGMLQSQGVKVEAMLQPSTGHQPESKDTQPFVDHTVPAGEDEKKKSTSREQQQQPAAAQHVARPVEPPSTFQRILNFIFWLYVVNQVVILIKGLLTTGAPPETGSI
ncbi:hypothetical protein FOZ62_008934, partial [Perkinsus olseni]